MGRLKSFIKYSTLGFAFTGLILATTGKYTPSFAHGSELVIPARCHHHEPSWCTSGDFVVSKPFAWVKRGPSLKYSTIRKVYRNHPLKLYWEDNGYYECGKWYLVKTGNERGWVHKSVMRCDG